MTTQCETRPPTGEREPRNDFDKTQFTSINAHEEVEAAFLRAAFRISASQLAATAQHLEEPDFHRPAAWQLFRTIVTIAHEQVTRGDGRTSIDPGRVLAELQSDGRFRDDTKHLLTAAISGGFSVAASNDIHPLARALKANRLRRECKVIGSYLAEVALAGSDSELQRALGHTLKLHALAQRAGLSDDMEGAYAR